MPGRPLHHLRNNAVGYVALFVALGGTSYAAISLPAGSVGYAPTPQRRGYEREACEASRDGGVPGSEVDRRATSPTGRRFVLTVMWSRQLRTRRVVMTPAAGCTACPGTNRSRRTAWRWRTRRTCPLSSDQPRPPHSDQADTVAARTSLVQTFDTSGNNVPENVNVIVICP